MGRSRFTEDIDIAVEIDLSQSGKLFQFLQKISQKIYVSETAINQAVLRKSEFNLIDPEGLNRYDIQNPQTNN